MTADDVAELLHIPSSTVSDYARRGVLLSIKLGRHRRCARSDVADAIEGLRLGRARVPIHRFACGVFARAYAKPRMWEQYA
ncbi:MAG: helix-turn-helix domain-containing protein, partial [Solirubrobacteraceae bacterium]